MALVTFGGYRTFSDSGSVYRYWTFNEDITDPVPEESIKKGDWLIDAGPDSAEKRFQVKRYENKKWDVVWASDDPAMIAEFMKIDLPRWRPPRELDTAQALRTLERQVDKLVIALAMQQKSGSGGTFTTMADAFKKRLNGRGTGEDAVQLGAFTLRGYYKYDSGSPYRIWTLIRDVPEIPAASAWAQEVGGPSHAAAGDELWEDRDDHSASFRLKRDDIVIGRPEWWQVSDAFGGVKPPWGRRAGVGAATTARGRDPAAILKDASGRVYLAEQDVPGSRIRRGDIITFYRRETTVPCMVIPLQVSDYEALRELSFDEIETFRLLNPRQEHGFNALDRFRRDKRKWGLKTKVWRPKLFVIRRITPEQVTDPVSAMCDDAALFELLAEVGCRMPDGGAA